MSRYLTDSPWYESRDNVVMLCRYLVERYKFDAMEIVRVFAEPWRWSREFEEAERAALSAA